MPGAMDVAYSFFSSDTSSSPQLLAGAWGLLEGFRSIVNQKISYGCEQESQDPI
jgi:hypothetical protein